MCGHLVSVSMVQPTAHLAMCAHDKADMPSKGDLSCWLGCCRIGDGDCGSTLRSGAEAVKAAVGASLPLNHAGGTLRGLAKTLRVMGGTSGALYNIALTAAAG